MQSLWFWKNWPLDYQVIWSALIILFVFSFFFLWYGYLKGPSGITDWTTFEQQETLETVSHTFEVGNFEISIPIESYLTFEYFNGTMVRPNVTASYIFLSGLIISCLVLLSIITTLDRFWYFAGMGVFILFMVSLRLEVLQLFQVSGRTISIVIMGVFVAISFYFNALKSSSPFLLRLIVFTIATLITGLVIYFFSGVRYPFLHLAVTGYVAGMILSVIFMMMVAHEIMTGFVYVTSSGTSSSKSLRHFFIISLIYLFNLTLAYMHEAGIIAWDFLYIDLYGLLSVSAVLGIWGFKHRESLYENLIPFNPFGAYLILALAAITFLTAGMLLGNHNDAPLKIIRDGIIFGHLGYGVIFMIYFISNFMLMVAENLSAWKVLYKPTRMPYFTFRFAGLIATMAFVFYSGWRDYVYHGISGFYNQIGDLYQLLDQKILAEAYYQQGRSYGFENNRSNYVLGIIESDKNNFKEAHRLYELANGKRPTEFSLVNDGNLYIIQRGFFEAIASFSKALNKYPDSGVIQNNLGFSFSKIHKLDSALILFDKSRQHSISKDVAESNFIALIGREYLPVKADSLLLKFKSKSPLAISNALAVASLQEQTFNFPVDPFNRSSIDLGTATQMNNYLVYKLKQLDTTALNRAAHIISDSVNADYSEALKATLAQAYYHQNNVTKALYTISELAFLSQIMQGKFNYIAGLWALEQGSPELAIRYFDYAVLFDYKEAKLYNAIALVEAHYPEKALTEADSLLKHPDEGIREIGRQLKKIITHPSSDIASLTDLEKYQYCRYRLGTRDTLRFDKIINTFENNDYKVLALLEMSKRQFDQMNMPTAIRYFKQIEGIPLSDRNLYEKVQYFELVLLASREETGPLAELINSGITFPKERELEKFLCQALISEAGGDIQTAEKYYSVLGTYNPFFEEGIIAASRFFKKHAEDDMLAYSTLAAAIQVNVTSYRLWMAYVAEALNVGFDSQAAYALEQAEELKERK